MKLEKKEELLALPIQKTDISVAEEVKKQWDTIAKPLDSLGKFERIFTKIGMIQGTKNISIGKRAVLVLCADNGVVEEGISQSTKEVTAIVAANMGKGITSVCRMAAPFTRLSKAPIIITLPVLSSTLKFTST